jgi:hypothetical protein
MFLEVEDDGSLWYVCNNKCCKHDEEIPQSKKTPLIDAETCNAALSPRTMADKIEPGFDARAWLEARGL